MLLRQSSNFPLDYRHYKQSPTRRTNDFSRGQGEDPGLALPRLSRRAFLQPSFFVCVQIRAFEFLCTKNHLEEVYGKERSSRDYKVAQKRMLALEPNLELTLLDSTQIPRKKMKCTSYLGVLCQESFTINEHPYVSKLSEEHFVVFQSF